MKKRFHKHVLYNIDNCKSDTVVMVEGIFDVMRLGKYDVCASFGTSFMAEQLLLLKPYKRIFMLYDSEGPAQEKAKKAANMITNITRGEVYNVNLGTGGDPDDLSNEDAEETNEGFERENLLMDIKVEKLDTKKEERVLLSMVVSTEFLNRMLSHIDITLFSSRASKTIVKWCTSYFEKYEKAPGNDLNVIYENSELELNDTDRQYIAGLLGKIGELSKTVDSESFNIEYQVDQAYEYFRSRKLDKLVSKVQNDLMSGKVDSAEDQVVQYMAVEKETSTGIDLFRDLERLKVMGLDEGTILFQPPGAFGEMTGPVRREDFIMFLASAKAGKSTMVQQMGDVGFCWSTAECASPILRNARGASQGPLLLCIHRDAYFLL